MNCPHCGKQVPAPLSDQARQDRIMELLKGARLMIEKLRVFGNDNVHKYDVQLFLDAIDAALG